VTALSTGESYSYDANGNMTSRTEGGLIYTQAFDTQNRLTSVTVSGQVTQFKYDPDGYLVKKIKPDGSKTLYIGGIYEVDKTSGGTVTGTKTYYPAAGAMRVGSTLYYILKDHLGSASVVTDATGTVVGEDRFYPFGETRITTGTMRTDHLFTGQT
jgi:YD repeat-containing protein